MLIGGGGFAGLALAIALRQGLGDPFKVTVADPALGKSHAGDARASAIAAAARRLFETIGVWDKVADGAQPILDMVVTDSKLPDVDAADVSDVRRRGRAGRAVRAYDRESGAGRCAGRAGQGGRRRASRRRGDGFRGRRGSHRSQFCWQARGSSAKLLVAADGARSAIREAAGIRSVGWDYDQAGIVTTVAHERDHHGRAEEHFLPAGPFAILPLKGKRSSIVWTEEKREAERIVALPDDGFHAELEKRFGLKLGEIEVAGPRRAYPLGLSMARSFVGERLALIGDAAHVIHPIAGQGLNLGLRDVAALAEAVVDAARLGLDPGGPDVLERYQRWRRFDTAAMGVATDGLNRLFSNRSDALRLVRDVGLGLVDRVPALKGLFIREAAGLTGDVPKLLRGEAL